MDHVLKYLSNLLQTRQNQYIYISCRLDVVCAIAVISGSNFKKFMVEGMFAQSLIQESFIFAWRKSRQEKSSPNINDHGDKYIVFLIVVFNVFHLLLYVHKLYKFLKTCSTIIQSIYTCIN